MPELHVEPSVLADAGRSLATQRSVLADATAALPSTLGRIAAALPGGHAAAAAAATGAALAAAGRSAETELAHLAGALTAAAREYTVVERSTAAGLERAGRRPA
jgi:hypothetical protein